jgi:hypothetical protein
MLLQKSNFSPFPKSSDAARHSRSGGLVLGREDVARRPGDLSSEGGEGLDEDGGLDGHVEASSDASSLEGLRGSVLLAEVHESRLVNETAKVSEEARSGREREAEATDHLSLGDDHLLTSPSGERAARKRNQKNAITKRGAATLGATERSSPCEM